MSKTILITGASGQVGKTAVTFFSQRGWQVYPCNSHDLDIRDTESVSQMLQIHSPDILFNCAAYTAVDKAEDEPDIAKKINCDAVKTLVKQCNAYNVLLIHLSTDYVFDGNSNIPYSETSEPNPLNTYGYTKLCGDKYIQKNSKNWLVIRTSWVYSSYGKNFLKAMINLGKKALKADTTLSIVDDQIGSPTSAEQLVEVTANLISDNSGCVVSISVDSIDKRVDCTMSLH